MEIFHNAELQSLLSEGTLNSNLCLTLFHCGGKAGFNTRDKMNNVWLFNPDLTTILHCDLGSYFIPQCTIRYYSSDTVTSSCIVQYIIENWIGIISTSASNKGTNDKSSFIKKMHCLHIRLLVYHIHHRWLIGIEPNMIWCIFFIAVINNWIFHVKPLKNVVGILLFCRESRRAPLGSQTHF